MTTVALLLAAGAGLVAFGAKSYEVQVLMPTADGTFVGGQVVLRGQEVGEITELGTQGDKALITATVDEEHAPLPAGTTARVSWESLLGTRVLELLPGQQKNPALRSGSMIESNIERVELDDVLAMLDEPTRDRVQGLVKQLNQTLQGREKEVGDTLNTAGPAVQAVGEVMRAVGEDGPAIRNLVKRLHAMTSELAPRRSELEQTVQNLGRLTSATAGKQEQLRTALAELPSTVREATTTLDRVPRTVDATVPLLRDLRPAAERLPSVARNLSPVLAELRPTLGDLKPTLASANSLLRYTPGLLDATHATLPGVDDAVTTLQPAVAFLRPYAPELTGWLTNWASVFANQNSSGNIGRILVSLSGTSLNNGVLPPGMKQDPEPAPGSIAGQPWVDANGDGMR
ncbi:MlaD family protein [Haloechinothrix alba]|uniref:MlaD family protein n=1 Tax=Haloechinothrix alba TaxID=664784 RepID=UPI001FE684DD|nr:MlaD family protein [Haloechinothrix alba]